MRGWWPVFPLLALAAGRPAAQAESSGLGPWATPGLNRVWVAGELEPGIAASALTTYGVTESVLSADDVHHRIAGSVAAMGRPLRWFSLGAKLDARHDVHDLAGQDDESTVVDGRIALRGDLDLRSGFSVGATGIVFVPGSDGASLSFDATTLDLRALLSFRPPDSALTLALDVGGRLDRSGRSVARPITYSEADFISLGVSDSNAVLMGFGAAYRFDAVELFGETSADLLLGPASIGDSPVRAVFGVRGEVAPGLLSLYSAFELGLGGRPPIALDQPLVPVEPRAAVTLGVMVYHRARDHATRAVEPPVAAHRPIEGEAAASQDAEPKRAPEPEPKPTPTRGVLEGRIMDRAGVPLRGVEVSLSDSPTTGVMTDAEGLFELADVPLGHPLELVARASGYKEQRWLAEPRSLEASARSIEVVTLEPDYPAGVLRGVVRSLRGDLLEARIRIEPGPLDLVTDAEGRFEVELEPGRYSVRVQAQGHTRQTRQVTVEEGGVTILNADLGALR